MLGVTLLALPCAYVGWQAKIVRERKAMARQLTELGCVPYAFPSASLKNPNDTFSFNDKTHRQPFPSVSLLRRWLGDSFIYGIAVPRKAPPNTLERARDVFPEADVIYATN